MKTFICRLTLARYESLENMSGLLHPMRAILDAALAFVYPQVCQICGEERATFEEGFVGPQCRATVRYIKPPFCARCGLPFEGAITSEFECSNCQGQEWHFTCARSVVVAREKMLEVIHRYKYQRALWFERYLGELLVTKAAPEISVGGWKWIVPVPLHPVKQREREFNQAERLARCLSKASGVPLNRGLLRRTEPTRTQTLLSRAERQANVRHAFSMKSGQHLTGERIVLIDDVFTTGATTGACARVLRSAGAGEVCVWTVARGV
jgi:ComF family protein